MDILSAIILGVVQGLTEFIPVSSTAHLVFAIRWLDALGGDPKQVTATMAVIQLGTLAAVFVYFAKDISAILRAFAVDHASMATGKVVFSWGGLSSEARLGWLVIIGSIPIGVLGLLFKHQIEGELTKNLYVIAAMMIVISIALAVAELIGKRTRGMEDLGLKDAVISGIAQAIALIPGASRSGSTIMGGLLAGQTREAAARFSFLLMLPAVTASGLLELKETWGKISGNDAMALAVGTIVAGLVGYASIWFLLAFLRKNSTFIFIVYRLAVASLILALLLLGKMDPVGI